MSGEVIEFLLRNCSRLERLIMKGILTSDLVISLYLPVEELMHPLKFLLQILLRLSAAYYDYELLFLENIPNLVEASICFAVSPCTMHHLPKYNVAKLESLTITLRRPKVFSVPQMPNLKKLVLDYHTVNREYLLPVTCLLHASPYLEEFTLEISDINMYFFDDPLYKAILGVPKNGIFRHMHYCLKVFEFAGFCPEAPDNIELVMYIVKNCVALEEIIITPIYTAVARLFIRRADMLHLLLDHVDAIAEERHALAMKKSTEHLFPGKIPHHIKLIIN